MKTLITGADGYLGSVLARLCLDAGQTLALWVHACDEQTLNAKKVILQDQLSGALDVYGGDLREPEPFRSLPAGEITHIVHAAAITNFACTREEADLVNIEGTRKLLAYACRQPHLQLIQCISSIYASGLRAGSIAEAPLAEVGFANHYERSKWAGEQLLQAPEFRHLPWQILRVATIIADDAGGTCRRPNFLHNSLKLLYHGLLPVWPGDRDIPVYLVTADWAGEFIRKLMTSDHHVIHHLCPIDPPTLGELMDTAFDVFSQEMGRPILMPPACNLDAFRLLTESTSAMGGILGGAMESISPFAPQLYIAKYFDHALTVAEGDALPIARNVCRKMTGMRADAA